MSKEKDFLKNIAPGPATHYLAMYAGVQAGGDAKVYYSWYLVTGKDVYTYITDSDNEYPRWVLTHDHADALNEL